MVSANPIFRDLTLTKKPVRSGPEVMTLNGTIYRAGFLLSCAGITAFLAWIEERRSPNSASLFGVALVCAAVAALLVWVTVRNRRWAVVTAPLYALLEGLILGEIAASVDACYPGIAVEGVALTFATCLFMMILYRSRLIHVTERFNKSLVAATGGVALFYLTSVTLKAMGVPAFAVFEGGVPGILLSAVVVAVAALNLVADFDFIEMCANSRAPKYMEWYAALGLIVTLVWLYVEILKLVSKAKRAERQPS